MPLLHIVVLALIQGLTEFLPISSSGHLVLIPIVTGWQDQGLTIDVAVHVGTLAAVALYFWRDLTGLASGLARLAVGRGGPEARLALHLVVATLPLVGLGIVVYGVLGSGVMRQVTVIAWATFGFGLLLLVADRFSVTVRRLEHMTLGHALFVGLAQGLALIPGTSRSGITITAARMLGYERREAARFALLMSIPAILGAGTLAAYDIYLEPSPALGLDALLAAGLAFVVALAAIAGMMRWLERATYTPFALYRLALGGGLLVWIYFG